jgi:hypothetical protein
VCVITPVSQQQVAPYHLHQGVVALGVVGSKVKQRHLEATAAAAAAAAAAGVAVDMTAIVAMLIHMQ